MHGVKRIKKFLSSVLLRDLRVSVVIFFLSVPIVSSADSRQLFDQLQSAIQSHDEKAYLAIVSQKPEIQESEKQFIGQLVTFGYQKAVFSLADDQDTRFIVHVFLEGIDEARLESWAFTTVLEDGKNLIGARRVISSLGGLYRLRMKAASIPVHNLQIKHFDATLHLKDGRLFLVTAGKQVAGVVFVGDGVFEFGPPDTTEQQQLTLFCKQPRLVTSMSYFYIRSSSSNLKALFGQVLANPAGADNNLYEKAHEIAEVGNMEAFNVNVPLTNELWFPQIEQDDFFCELKTSYGTLLYQYSGSEKENVLLVQKEKDQIISLYTAGRSISFEEEENEFQILQYKMKVNYVPKNAYFSAISEVQLQSNTQTSTIIFKLNPNLRVTKIASSQGPLIYFQENQTKNLHLILKDPVQPGEKLALSFYYQGSIAPETARSEAQTRSRPTPEGRASPEMPQQVYIPPTYLYSNQSIWYPQLSSKIYCDLVSSITVPTGYVAIANGRLVSTQNQGDQKTFNFSAEAPIKFFSLIIGRLDGYFTFQSVVPIDVYYLNLDKKSALDFARAADKILRFYSDYFGAYPYRNLTLVLRPLQEPGGHAPATIAVVNRVFSFWQLKFRKDPLYQPDFPMLTLAHEIAHQWWGQAVGWRDYHDQWLSEGFAQFAAWEYIRYASGDKDWSKLAHTFYDWIEEKTYAGPLVLGARLGHLSDDPRAFSALLYHKGAYVLNMLKNWLGPDKFKQCLQEYYRLYRFKYAGIEEFQEVAQRYSNESLQAFFRQWLYQWEIPALDWSEQTEKKNSDIYLKLRFSQPHAKFYQLVVPVEVRRKDGNIYRTTVKLDHASQEVELRLPFAPDDVEIDPMHENLMKPIRR